MSKLLIFGAGGQGKVIAEAAVLSGEFTEIAFLDDRTDIHTVLGISVIGKFEDYKIFTKDYDHFFVAIGNNKVRKGLILELIRAGYKLPVIIHPKSIISNNSKINMGSCVLAGAVVGPNCVIGVGCIINSCAIVPHDCFIGDYNHISCGAVLGGSIITGESTLVGLGSTLINGIKVGSNVIIAAGAAVINNIESCIMVAGVPATVKKRFDV